MKMPKLEFIGRVYRPSDDTWLAINLLDRVKPPGDICLDLGCGSGVLGLYAILNGYCKRVVFVDIDHDAVETANLNTLINKVQHRSLVALADDVVLYPNSVDVVLANPPYLPANEEGVVDKAVEAGPEGYEVALYFIDYASTVLKSGGYLILVYSSLSKPQVIQDYLKFKGFKVSHVLQKQFFIETIYAVGCIKIG